MPFASNPSGGKAAAVEAIDPPAPLHLKLGLKTIVPHDVVEVVEGLWSRRDEFPSTVECPICGDDVPLSEVNVEWPYTSYSVAFHSVPGYNCAACGRTYFPMAVFSTLADVVERTVRSQKPAPFKPNPRALNFAQWYAHR